MIAGELLIKLGVIGADKAKSGIEGIKGAISGVGATGLAAVAAITGMAYSLKTLAGHAMEAGVNLTLYGKATGMSSQMLEKYAYAARHAGISSQEMEGNLVGLQKKMIDMSTRGGAVPAGFGLLKSATKLDTNRLRDTDYMFSKLVELANMAGKGKGKIPVDFVNQALESFGLSTQMMGAMRMGQFNKNVYANAPVTSDRQMKASMNMRNAIGDMEDRFQRGADKIVTKFGPQLLPQIEQVTNALLEFMQSVASFSEQTGAIKLMAEAIQGLADVIGLLTGHMPDIDEKRKGGTLAKAGAGIADWAGDAVGSLMNAGTNIKTNMKNLHTVAAHPNMRAVTAPANVVTNVEVNQNVHGVHNPEKLARDVAHHVKKHVKQGVEQTMRAQHSGGRKG